MANKPTHQNPQPSYALARQLRKQQQEESETKPGKALEHEKSIADRRTDTDV
jgi:hypothetical protein